MIAGDSKEYEILVEACESLTSDFMMVCLSTEKKKKL